MNLLTFLAFAVHWTTPSGAPLHRTDASNIRFLLNSDVPDRIPGATAATQAALDSWNAIPNTSLHFAALASTAAGTGQDSQNVIAFATTPSELASVGTAVAVTIPYGFSDGRVIETDILLNPAIKFSTTGEAGAYDLQSIVTHELGHALGSNHATALSSTMYWQTLTHDAVWATLKPDDAAFAVETYPAASASYGTLTGRVTKNGNPVPGAAILAIDPSTGVSIGGLSSLSDGSYSLAIPPGSYNVYASPVTPFTPPTLFYGLTASLFDIAFKATPVPAAISISPGLTASSDIAATAGASPVLIAESGKFTAKGVSWSTTPLGLTSGQSTELVLFGPGLDPSVTLTLIGPGIALRPGTLRADSSLKDASGYTATRFTVDVQPVSSVATAALLVTKGAGSAMLPGGLVLYPPKPVFTAASIGNAGSGATGGVAPGELVSLYGTGLGPGASVSFDGVPAPIVYFGNGQLNLQVPYEVAGKPTTTVKATNPGGPGDPVTLNVVAAHPGVFAAVPNPVTRGTYVTLYATGAGVVTPPLATGQIAPGNPLSFAPSASVTIAGQDAPVYQGSVLSPGFIGLLQISALVPATAPVGPAQLILTVAGQTAAPITITVN